MMFGLAITNASEYDHNGNHVIRLTFNQTTSPSESVVVCRKLDNPPLLDGQDNGLDEWGAGSTGLSSVPLENIRGLDSRIETAYLRAGYDDRYIYMMIQWEEKNVDSVGVDSTFTLFSATASWNPEYWKYLSTGSLKWNRVPIGEDQAFVYWPIKGVTDWAASGSALLYHDADSNIYLSGDGSVDLWHWRAGRTGHLGFFDDEVITSEGVFGDQGTPAFRTNDLDSAWADTVFIPGQPPIIISGTVKVIRYMHRLDPQYSAEPPLMTYDAVPFVASPPTTKQWRDNNTIPSFISISPLGGRANIECSASVKSWEAGSQFWTVEMRRLRNTGHGDDVQF
jgi:hypothetical protein